MSETQQHSNERRLVDRGPERGEERRRGALRTNPEVMERRDAEVTRENPEVMGRSEPQTMTPPRQTEGSSEMNDIRMRFDQLQSEFIDDPKRAVTKAQKLLDEMLNKMTEKIHNTHRDVEKTDDTERLRLAMRSYRDMIDSFTGGRRSA